MWLNYVKFRGVAICVINTTKMLLESFEEKALGQRANKTAMS